jgi:hypothetical protein
MICCKSYQDIPEDPRYAGPDTEDYFDMFLTAWCKENSIKDVNDEDYEVIRRYWYEFENGNGEEPGHNSDKTLEEMAAELKEYDENREKHTCETCERKRDDVFCSHCRTGCNDDYTLSDYWHSYTRVEKALWGRIAQLQNDKGELVDEVKSLKAQIDKMKSIGRTSYIKGIRTMANDLKTYDRVNGAWTDYFEHTVDKVLKNLLKEIKEK